MGMFSRLFGNKGGRSAGSAPPDRGLYVHLRCNGTSRQPCGEALRVRINPQNDLLEEFEDDEERVSGYTVHKDVLGTRCQNMMQLTIRYDANRREIGRQADGATLIDAAEYERLRQAPPPKGSGG